MAIRTIARYVAMIGIACLPLTVITPAHAINKHETGGKSAQSQCLSQQASTTPWSFPSFAQGHPPESP